ncbi:hypothetical protein ABVK25_012198 [Lepraria finkii]|uniref:Uncharacterized protein n=1 Tax=Lepraria finkii TaxID=1340010 RepID=A0ABR4AI10_9LECA
MAEARRRTLDGRPARSGAPAAAHAQAAALVAEANARRRAAVRARRPPAGDVRPGPDRARRPRRRLPPRRPGGGSRRDHAAPARPEARRGRQQGRAAAWPDEPTLPRWRRGADPSRPARPLRADASRIAPMPDALARRRGSERAGGDAGAASGGDGASPVCGAMPNRSRPPARPAAGRDWASTARVAPRMPTERPTAPDARAELGGAPSGRRAPRPATSRRRQPRRASGPRTLDRDGAGASPLPHRPPESPSAAMDIAAPAAIGPPRPPAGPATRGGRRAAAASCRTVVGGGAASCRGPPAGTTSRWPAGRKSRPSAARGLRHRPRSRRAGVAPRRSPRDRRPDARAPTFSPP